VVAEAGGWLGVPGKESAEVLRLALRASPSEAVIFDFRQIVMLKTKHVHARKSRKSKKSQPLRMTTLFSLLQVTTCFLDVPDYPCVVGRSVGAYFVRTAMHVGDAGSL